MSLPGFTAEASLYQTSENYSMVGTSVMSTAQVVPQGCSLSKKIACGFAIAACGYICYQTLGLACANCLLAIGASECIDCF